MNNQQTLARTRSEPPRPRAIPAEDGVSHINIYTKGKTPLGRALSHFTHAPFTHPVFGPFENMEGCWHWVKSEERPDELRYMVGFAAKNYGKLLTKKMQDDFQDLILECNYCKIVQNPWIQELLLESDLPFDHYYLHGPDKDMSGRLLAPEAKEALSIPIRPRSCDWLAPIFSKIRDMLRNGEVPKGLQGLKYN